MKDKAYAKVNLALDVFNIRDNGYHDIKSIMVPLDFYDDIEIEISDKDEFICNTELKYNEHNTIYKMIHLVKEKYNINDHFKITLNKRIPAEAGLAGGTADGASTLRILNKLYNLKLNKQEIKELCVKVGADVLFNYYNTPSLVSGIGDELEFINIKKDYYILLVKPNSGVSTKQAYELLDMNKCDHPDVDKLKDNLISGLEIKNLLGNSLEEPALKLNKDISDIKNKILKYTDVAIMSGSGSTVFSIDEDENKIKDIYNKLKDLNCFVEYTKLLKQDSN